jgi:hypothetical protein
MSDFTVADRLQACQPLPTTPGVAKPNKTVIKAAYLIVFVAFQMPNTACRHENPVHSPG